MIDDPAIDVIDITAPDVLQKDMALIAIGADKHVYCEKLLAPMADDAAEIAQRAAAKGIETQVAFNYLCNPMLRLAREMIAAGELGEIRQYRGLHAEGYVAKANLSCNFPAGAHRVWRLGHRRIPDRSHYAGHVRLRHGNQPTPERHRQHAPGRC